MAAKKSPKAPRTSSRILALRAEHPGLSTEIDKPITSGQRDFVFWYCQPNMTCHTAAKRANYHPDLARAFVDTPRGQAAIAAQRAANQGANTMTLKRVTDGFLRAAEIAELNSESIAMTAAWREIGRLYGMYAPKKVEHKISLTAEALAQRIKSMDENQLKALADGSVTLEGEFEVLTDGNQPDSSESGAIPDDFVEASFGPTGTRET